MRAVPVRKRSAARVAAIQITYQSLITGQSVVDFVPQFLSHYADEVSKSFCVKDLDHDHLTDIYTGVEAERDELDNTIGAVLSDGWSIDRLARIELAVLRCGAYELTAMQHISTGGGQRICGAQRCLWMRGWVCECRFRWFGTWY